ncbi:22419_t:CDS:2 [Gigaspora margarita]|uniref:22419_t:CDS:1 n=1 Tax=Gigaspora margarita TaxID=4874 RepID=A0ABN7UAM4_GIGMA|nr:22419_t:CDS:2 [Gigaspora margarita]
MDSINNCINILPSIRVPFISDDNETNRQDFDHHHDKANKKLLELSDNTTSAHNASQLAAFHADADRIIKDCYEGTAVVKSRHEDLDRSDYYALEIELLANVLRNAIDGYKESENKLSTYYQKVKIDLKQEANKLIKQNPETNKVRILNIFSKVTGALVKFSDAIALEHHKLELVRKIYAHAKFAHDIKNWMSSCKLAMLNIQVGIIDQEVEIVSLEEEVASFQITVDQFKNMSYQVILPETDSRDIDEPQPEDKIKEFVQKRINRVLDEWHGLKDQLIKLRSNLDASKESQGLSHTIKDILANIEARVLNIESFITGEGIQRLPTKDDVIDRVRELDEIQERVDHLLTLKIEALDSMIIDLTDVQQRAGIAKALKNLQSLIEDKRVQLREAVKLVKFVKKADEMNTLMSSLLEITNTTTPDCPLQLLNVIDLQSRFTELNTKYDYIVRKLEGVKRAAEPLKDDWRVVNRLSILIEQWNELNKIVFAKKDELSCLLSGQKPLTKTQPGRSNSRMSISRSNSLMSASRSDSRMSGSRSMSQPLYLAIPILSLTSGTFTPYLTRLTASRVMSPRNTPSPATTPRPTSKTPTRLSYSIDNYVPDPTNQLDVEVARIVYACPVKIKVSKVEGEPGKYMFGEVVPKLCYCRISKSRMVMVRVGGGWEELSNSEQKYIPKRRSLPGVVVGQLSSSPNFYEANIHFTPKGSELRAMKQMSYDDSRDIKNRSRLTN